MAAFDFNFRAVICWLLVGVLSGALPATGADAVPGAPSNIARVNALESAVAPPGILAPQDPTPPSVVQQPPDQTPTTVAPAKSRLPRWVWMAVATGLAVGAGAAIVVTNNQSGRTSASIPGVTVNVGGPSPGGPH